MTTSEHLLPATKNPNPRNWKFTWESNSHVPILKLYLINPNTNPISQCIDLKVSILFHKSLLQLTWIDNNQSQSLWVPIPRVLIDADSPISFRALDDHIEVKLVLVLPVDHPIVSNFDFEGGLDAALDDDCQPLQLDSDLKKLASCGEVHFFCRGCSTKLSSAVRNFKEMPSVNWREAADNWFGTCCCSFGGASEKLVAQYANSYSCTPGVCLVDPTSIVLYEDQTHSTSELLTNKASLLNGLLGNCFMVASPYLSKDIKWSEILCPHCSCLLGAYPHDNTDGLLNDYGVHLFKCFISTCPVGGPTDLFWKYTLERMFTSQLLESAKDELSFRTVVKNLQTRSPMLQIVLLNPNAWCSFGDCLDAMIPVPNFIMYPMVKVLFSNCSNSTESELRKLDEWVTKHQVGDVYMLTSKDLAESLEIANRMLPSSHAFLQGLSLSFLRR
ncbi:putative ubiquitin-conjugating enzyme E2-binding protein [Helianthus annuus]|nr:putative ubiquitin-conjugating enzyme E2-binding protein [Helianthus annuus]